MTNNKILALDFDGTVCVHAFPEIGEIDPDNQRVINYVREAKTLGYTIILWTCRTDQLERLYLTEAVNWCVEHDIPIDYINEPSPEIRDMYGNDPRKICADIYVDDRACHYYDVYKHKL